MIYMFASTSKVTLQAGMSMIIASENNIKHIRNQTSMQTPV